MIGRGVVCAVVLAGGGAIGLSEQARGAVIDWIAPGGGAFSEGANWDGGTPPGELDRARFDVDATYQVTISQSTTTLGAQFRAGVVSIDASGTVWMLTDPDGTSLRVGQTLGEDAAFELVGGVILCESAKVGETLGATGRISIPGAGLGCLRQVVIGEGGDGTIEITQGGFLGTDSRIVLGSTLGGVGRLDVLGEGSRVEVAQTVTAGVPDVTNLAAPTDPAQATPRGSDALSRVRVGAGASLMATTTTLGPDGLLEGAGTILAGVENGGLLRPGIEGVGLLSIDGDYTQEAAGAIEFEIGGALPGEHDQLAMTGAAALDGAITVAFAGGFTPSLGQSFTLLTADGGVSGVFSGVSLPAPPSGTVLVVEFEPNAVIVEVREEMAGVDGDLNGDGQVDAADLAALLGRWGTSDPDADLNGDGLVNAQDLARVLGFWTS